MAYKTFSILMAVVAALACAGCCFHQDWMVRLHCEMKAKPLCKPCADGIMNRSGCSYDEMCRAGGTVGGPEAGPPAEPPIGPPVGRFHPVPTKPVFPPPLPEAVDAEVVPPPGAEMLVPPAAASTSAVRKTSVLRR